MRHFILRIVSILHFSAIISSKGMNGITLKLTTYDNPPYDKLKQNPDGTYKSSGTNTKIFDWLAQKLNFSYIIVDPIVDKALIAKYTVYELAFAKLISKQVDGLLGTIVVNTDKAEKMDFTSMVWTEPYTLVARKPGQQSRIFAFIRPFQPMTWLVLFISVIVIIVLMSWFSFIFAREPHSIVVNDQKKKKNSKKKSKNVFEQLINAHSFRILAGGWLLTALVLVNIYSSIVVSSLTVPAMESAINSFEDLANSKDVSIILNKNVVIGQLILGATTGVFKTLGDQARQNPDQQLHINSPSILKNLETGHFAYPFIQSYNRNFVSQQYRKDGKCRFQSSSPLQMSTGYFSILLQKHFRHTATLSIGLTYLWETGLTRYWVEHDLPNVYECFDQNRKPRTSINKVVTIKLEDLVSAFLILGIGMGLGLLAFLLELIIKYYDKNRKPNPPDVSIDV